MNQEETLFSMEEIEDWCRQERRKNADYLKQRLLKAVDDLGETALRVAIAELSKSDRRFAYAVLNSAKALEEE